MQYREFCKIFMPLHAALYRIACYMLESQADAQDVLQDLYLKLWNTRGRLDTVANPRGYCITLVRNLCIDRIRQAGRFSRPHSPSGTSASGTGSREPEPEDPAADIEKAMADKERLNAVRSAAAKLSEGQRQVLEMRLLDNLSYDEIAARTGKSKLTLRVLLSTARKTLKAQI